MGLDWRRQVTAEHMIADLDPVDHSPPLLPVAGPVAVSASVVDTQPVNEPAFAVGATAAQSFVDDYYNRIHVNPHVIAFGNILNSQTVAVEVWNAHFESKLLSSIDGTGTDDLTLDAPEAAPTTFPVLESRVYTLGANTDGPPTINALYTFNFPAETPTLSVTGNRVVVWPFIPQWPATETIEYLTNIIPSRKNEQRIALRQAPRQGFGYTFQLSEIEYSRAKALADWTSRVFGLPLWIEVTQVGAISSDVTEILLDTADVDWRPDDMAIIWESSTKFEAAETVSILADRITISLPLTNSYDHALVMPLRFARALRGVQYTRSSHPITIARASFAVTNNADLSVSGLYQQYRGADLVTDRLIAMSDLSESIAPVITVIDNGTGPIEVEETRDWLNDRKVLSLDAQDRARRWALRQWLDSRRGKQKSFWLPTWSQDLTLVSNVSATATVITVEAIGYPLYYTVTDVMVLLVDNTIMTARVLSGETVSVTTEELTLEAAFGQAFDVADVDRFCFLHHVRLDADKIAINHKVGQSTYSIPAVVTPE